MSPRTVISWAQNALIFDDVGFAFRLTFLNKCDEAERATVAEYYQRVFGKDLPESVVGQEQPSEAGRWPTPTIPSKPSASRWPGRRGRLRGMRRSSSASPATCRSFGQERQGADAGALARARRRRPRRAASPMRRRCGCGITMRGCTSATRPADEVARAVFDAAEQARVEALGARGMDGVRANLAGLAEMRLRTDPLVRARSREEVPLGSAIGLIVRERLTGEAPPEAARARARAGRRLDRGESGRRPRRARPRDRRPGRLRRAGDQDAARPRAGRGRGRAPMPIPMRARKAKATTRPKAATDEGDDEEDGGGRGEAEIRGEQDQSGEDGASRLVRGGDGRFRRRARRGGRGGHAAGPPEPAALRSAAALRLSHLHHRNMTRRSTRPTLCDEEELGRLRAYLDQQLVHLQSAVTKLANRLQRRLMAQQSRSWEFDQEEGLLDAARLARVIVNPVHSLSYKVERDTEFRDTDRHPADRQFGLDARPADLDRRDQRRHPRPHARALRGQGRDIGLHHPRLEGRPVAREMAGRRPAAQSRPAQRSAAHRLQAGRRALAAGAQEPRADDARGAARRRISTARPCSGRTTG